jgi:hypothetical protein
MASNILTANDVQNSFDIVNGQLEEAMAICNAMEVLFALERAPVHQDSHPSYNIRTGGGYAHI